MIIIKDKKTNEWICTIYDKKDSKNNIELAFDEDKIIIEL